MDENANGHATAGGNGRRRGNIFWLLLILAVVVIWWWWRKIDDNGLHAYDDPASVYEGDRDDILVDLKDGVGDDVVARIEAEQGIDLVLVSDEAKNERLYRAHVDPLQRDQLLLAIKSYSEVEVAEPDAEFSLIDEGDGGTWAGYPNDPQYKYQWHLRQIGMPEAWKLEDGDGVIVAVIDTGVAYEDYKKFHRVPDLAGTKFVKGYDFVNNDKHANDDHGHGTHVSGTIAQATNNGVGVAGVAHGATIMPLKVLSANGSGSVAGIADAIHYAADNGAKVINMSLGGRFSSKILEKAVKYAHSKGVVVVCAAGNDGRGKVSYPAAYPGSIAVAATQFDETTTFYSNWGKEIDIAAPGGNTQVDQDKDGRPDGVLQNTIKIGDPTQSDYYAYMGTSMASPHVAGVAALVVASGVTEPDAVEKVLKESARSPKHGKLDKARYGAGIVDAPAAVKKSKTSTGASQLVLGLFMAGAVAASARRRGLGIKLGPSYLLGVMVGASGLFFLPWLSARVAGWPVVSSLTYGFPSWDLGLFGPGGHGNLLFFSALAPLALIAAGYGVRKLRGALAGFAIGVGAHLLFHAAARIVDVHWIPMDQAWLLVNATLAGGLGYLVLRDEK